MRSMDDFKLVGKPGQVRIRFLKEDTDGKPLFVSALPVDDDAGFAEHTSRRTGLGFVEECGDAANLPYFSSRCQNDGLLAFRGVRPLPAKAKRDRHHCDAPDVSTEDGFGLYRVRKLPRLDSNQGPSG